MRAEQPRHFNCFTRAPDEGRQGGREVAGRARPKWRELLCDIWMGELANGLGQLDAAQSVPAEVHELCSVGQRVRGGIDGR